MPHAKLAPMVPNSRDKHLRSAHAASLPRGSLKGQPAHAQLVRMHILLSISPGPQHEVATWHLDYLTPTSQDNGALSITLQDRGSWGP